MSPYALDNLSLRDASSTLMRVESILADAFRPEGLDADTLFNWTVRDSAEAILAAGDVGHLTRADEVNVTNNQISLDQFKDLNELANFERDAEAVGYTLNEAFGATAGFETVAEDSLLDNYAIVSGSTLSNAITVAQANTMLDVVDGAINNPLETLEWDIDDSPQTLVDNLTTPEVSQAQTVTLNETETFIVFENYQDLLDVLGAVEEGGSFALGGTRVRYTMKEAVESDGLVDNYEIVPDVPYQPGSIDIATASDTLEQAEEILEGAYTPTIERLDSLFDWTVLDSAEAILAAGDVAHLTRADELNVTNDQITLDQFTELEALANYVRSGEAVEYSLDGNPAIGSAPESFTDFTTGTPPEGRDQLFIELADTELPQLRGYDTTDWENTNFAQYTDESEALGVDVAFAVFTTAEFTGADTGWLNDLGLEDGEVTYLLAGNGETLTIDDDAQLYRVEGGRSPLPMRSYWQISRMSRWITSMRRTG
ncbi:hypothetical protein HLB35_14595 [Halomonas sp. TBZ9]|uniref:Uncharacterized protein n=1 Tax=Vreelandella azerica TaxID=2732867 RepID=A0A7Y3TZQ2_9GAMM|nr:hypothetical protein [Halomonas azerica]NOG32680.1 hypothetical protein [Halomonas azerica]